MSFDWRADCHLIGGQTVISSKRLCKRIRSASESEICIFSLPEVQISRGNLCHLIGGQTKQSHRKIEFVQTTG